MSLQHLEVSMRGLGPRLTPQDTVTMLAGLRAAARSTAELMKAPGSGETRREGLTDASHYTDCLLPVDLTTGCKLEAHCCAVNRNQEGMYLRFLIVYRDDN